MICLVTGAAGFIGSHLCRRLLKEKYSVIGIDSFADYYPRWIKEKNIDSMTNDENFDFYEDEINTLDMSSFIKKADFVFHLAAQAGVRASWGQNFSIYTKNNIEATQKLLEIAKENPISKFIYASSSSVYGYCPELPTSESSPLHPYSPYGVSKLAGEQLCVLYHKNYGVPTVSLRLFTVYGPSQRPDMAFHKFFKAISEGKPISIYGDGKQTRDFTYIDDIIEAFFLSMTKGKHGEIYNVGGGNRKILEDIFPILERITQNKIEINREKNQKGDVLHTFAKIEKAKMDLGFSPQTQLEEGLREEWLWLKNLYSI